MRYAHPEIGLDFSSRAIIHHRIPRKYTHTMESSLIATHNQQHRFLHGRVLWVFRFFFVSAKQQFWFFVRSDCLLWLSYLLFSSPVELFHLNYLPPRFSLSFRKFSTVQPARHSHQTLVVHISMHQHDQAEATGLRLKIALFTWSISRIYFIAFSRHSHKTVFAPFDLLPKNGYRLLLWKSNWEQRHEKNKDKNDRKTAKMSFCFTQLTLTHWMLCALHKYSNQHIIAVYLDVLEIIIIIVLGKYAHIQQLTEFHLFTSFAVVNCWAESLNGKLF